MDRLLRLSDHAITRYQERVRPDLDRPEAIATLIADIEALDGAVIADAKREIERHVHMGTYVLGVSRGKVITTLKPANGDTRRTYQKCEYCEWSGPYKPFLAHVMQAHLQPMREAAE
jgi:hypothetical protein